jgi:hypothetical protein
MSKPRTAPAVSAGLPQSQPSAEVIDFPQVSGAHALDPAPTPIEALADRMLDQARRDRDVRDLSVGSTRWGWLIALGMLLFGGVSLVQWHVVSTATATFKPQPVNPEQPAVEGEAGEAGEEVSGDTGDAGLLYEELETDIRNQMMADTLMIAGPGDLGDNLLIELRRVRLDVVAIDARVVEWGGRNRDVPLTADVRIRYRTSGDGLDRELGAIALVMGKYLQHFDMELTRFDVIFEGLGDRAMQRSLDAKGARGLYLRRIGLEDYLTEM